MTTDWTDDYAKFIQKISHTEPDREHLPYCKSLTGHCCNCWQERIFKIKQEAMTHNDNPNV